MAVYTCECGLIISTSSERPQCLRCHRVLGAQDLIDRANEAVAELIVSAVAVGAGRRQYRQVTMGYRLNERPVTPPAVRPK